MKNFAAETPQAAAYLELDEQTQQNLQAKEAYDTDQKTLNERKYSMPAAGKKKKKKKKRPAASVSPEAQQQDIMPAVKQTLPEVKEEPSRVISQPGGV